MSSSAGDEGNEKAPPQEKVGGEDRKTDTIDIVIRSGVDNGDSGSGITVLDAVVVRDKICPFLPSDDVVNLLRVGRVAVPFRLREFYCDGHGTKLDVMKHDPALPVVRGGASSKASNDSETAECEEEQCSCHAESRAFFDRPEHPELPSRNPNCLDCRMARLHNKKKCPCCEEYELTDDFGTCEVRIVRIQRCSLFLLC